MFFPTNASATRKKWSNALTSVSQDAFNAVFGPPVVVLQLFLLDFILILLFVAFAPELTPHDATDGADCKKKFVQKAKVTIYTYIMNE